MVTAKSLLLGLAAFVFACGYVPAFSFPTWTPRMAVLIVVLPFGVTSLIRQAIRPDLPARLAVAVMAWSAIAAALSPVPRLAFFGAVGANLSVVILWSLLGAWALCRSLVDDEVKVVSAFALLGAGFSLAVGTAYVVLRLPDGAFGFYGRAAGLSYNPVDLGALCAAVVAVCAWAWTRWPRRALLGLALTWFSFGVGISGSRVALFAAGVAVVVGAARGVRQRGWQIIACFAAGVALASVATGTSAAGRVATRSTTSGDGRLEMWRLGLHAVGQRPIAGWGLGQFRLASQRGMSRGLEAVMDGIGSLDGWVDAHNVVVEVAVALGLVGLVLLAGFALVAMRSSRGPLVWAVSAVMVTWMLQPAVLETAPLAFCLLGLARRAPVDLPSERRTVRAVTWGLASLLGSWFVVGNATIDNAVRRGNAEAAATASRFFPGDPVVADVVARMYSFEGVTDPVKAQQALVWSRRVTMFEPGRPRWWNSEAVRQAAFGTVSDAQAALDESFELEPNNPRTWRIQQTVAARRGDAALEAKAHAMVCELAPDETC